MVGLETSMAWPSSSLSASPVGSDDVETRNDIDDAREPRWMSVVSGCTHSRRVVRHQVGTATHRRGGGGAQKMMGRSRTGQKGEEEIGREGEE